MAITRIVVTDKFCRGIIKEIEEKIDKAIKEKRQERINTKITTELFGISGNTKKIGQEAEGEIKNGTIQKEIQEILERIKEKNKEIYQKIVALKTAKIKRLSELSIGDLKNTCFFCPVTRDVVNQILGLNNGNIAFNQNLDFSGSVFLEEVNFDNAIFSEKVYFVGSTFCKKTNFKRVDFAKTANFNNATFKASTFKEGQKENHFWGAIFKKVFFTKAEFKAKMDFRATTFCGNAYFQDAIFEQEKPVLMDGAVIEEKAKLIFSDGHLPKRMDRGGASLLKFHHDQRKDFLKADEFYQMEMDARRRELSFKKKPIEWAIFQLGKVTSDFGQNWLLPLLWILFFNFSFYLSLNWDEVIYFYNYHIPIKNILIVIAILMAILFVIPISWLLLCLLIILNFFLFFLIQTSADHPGCPLSFGEFAYPLATSIPDCLEGWQDSVYVVSRIISLALTYLLVVSLKRKTTRKY